MSSDPDFHRSADAWLDGSATPGEGKILQEILTDHPGESRNFAHLARTHAALELASKTQAERRDYISQMLRPSLRQKARKLWTPPVFKWTAAAAALAVGAAWWFQQSNLENRDSGGVDRVQKQKAAAVANTQVAPSPLTNLPPADTGYTKRMENFIIPEFSVDGMELLEAIALLTDKVTGLGENATFQVEITDLSPESADRRVFLNLNYQTASTLLHLIALQTGMKVQASGQTWHLSPAEETASDSVEYQEISAERWQAFRLSQMPPPPPTGGIVGHVSGRGLEPPPKSLPTAAAPLPDLKQLSAALINAVREAPQSVEPIPPKYKGAATTLKVGSSQKLNAMLKLLMAGPEAPGTLSFDLRWALFKNHAAVERVFDHNRKPEATVGTGGPAQWSEENLPQLLKLLAEDTDIKVDAAPPLRIAPGREGVSLSGTSMPLDQINDTPWTGQAATITNIPSGDKSVVSLKVNSQLPNANGGISAHEMASKLTLSAGSTFMIGGNINTEGEHMLILTARLPGAVPYGIPVTDKPGFVRSPYAFDKGMVDVEGVPPGTKVICPYSRQTFRIPE